MRVPLAGIKFRSQRTHIIALARDETQQDASLSRLKINIIALTDELTFVQHFIHRLQVRKSAAR